MSKAIYHARAIIAVLNDLWFLALCVFCKLILGGPAGAALLVVAITRGKTGLKEWIGPLFGWGSDASGMAWCCSPT